MGEGLAIGFGMGVVGILTVVIMGYILQRRARAGEEEAEAERRSLQTRLEAEQESSRVLEGNVTALRVELQAQKNTCLMIQKQLRSVEEEANDLRTAIETSQPSALPSVLRAQLDRLRQKASMLTTAPTTATGDPPGGEGDPVHDKPEGGGTT